MMPRFVAYIYEDGHHFLLEQGPKEVTKEVTKGGTVS